MVKEPIVNHYRAVNDRLLKKDTMPGLKVLHLISQRPDATGSGVYVQAMLRHAAQKGHCNHLVAGIIAAALLSEGWRLADAGKAT